MGEIADMMLDGARCQWCCELLDGHGFPVVCPGCQARHGVDMHGNPRKKKNRRKRQRSNEPRGLSAGDLARDKSPSTQEDSEAS